MPDRVVGVLVIRLFRGALDVIEDAIGPNDARQQGGAEVRALEGELGQRASISVVPSSAWASHLRTAR
jgi:hypothetical protein